MLIYRQVILYIYELKMPKFSQSNLDLMELNNIKVEFEQYAESVTIEDFSNFEN